MIAENTITLDINGEFTRFTSTGLRGDTLIKHWLDQVIEVKDIQGGATRGYFTTEVIAHILDEDESDEELTQENNAEESTQENLVWHPEMGQTKPVADCELRDSRNSGYIIKTKLELPTSRSVKFEKTYRSEDLTPFAQGKVGWHQYRATKHGLELLKRSGYTFSYEALLS